VAIGAELTDVLDGWAHDGVTGEQVQCAADLLRIRAGSEPALARLLAAAAGTDESLAALAGLARAFHRDGQWAAAAWCAERYAELRPLLGAESAAPPVLAAPILSATAPARRETEEAFARMSARDGGSADGWGDDVAPETLAVALALAEADDPASWIDGDGVLPPQRTA
jgi:hypothetical protein